MAEVGLECLGWFQFLFPLPLQAVWFMWMEEAGNKSPRIMIGNILLMWNSSFQPG